MSDEKALLLDTNAITRLLDERKPGHAEALAAFTELVKAAPATGPGKVFPIEIVGVPALVIYEIRRGLMAKNAKKRLRDLNRFLRTYTWIDDFDEAAATEAALLWAERRKSGAPAGELDLMILAVAKVNDADVITYDDGFPTVKGVTKRRWEELLP